MNSCRRRNGSIKSSQRAKEHQRSSKDEPFGVEHQQQQQQQRHSSIIYDSRLFLKRLREFKAQSVGCLEARRKSSSVLIFPQPRQACLGQPKCVRWPHGVKPTTGYWIECQGNGEAVQGGSRTRGGDDNDNDNDISSERSELEQTSSPLRARSELKLIVDCASQSSSSSGSQITFTAPSGEGSSTRFDCDSILDTDVGDTQSLASSSSRQANINNFHQSIDLRQSRLQSGKLVQEKHLKKSINSERSNEKELPQPSGRLSSKRCLTRDDIDLHKSRIESPNRISVLIEPSSNAGRVNYKSISACQQDSTVTRLSQSEQLKGSEESSDSPLFASNDPLKFERKNSLSAKDEAKAIIPNFTGVEIDSFEANSESVSSCHSSSYNTGNATELLYRQRARPSVIQEDSDLYQIKGNTNEEEYRFGLSCNRFNKRPYWEKASSDFDHFQNTHLDLISSEDENYERYYYGSEHWNYFTNDELLGPVMLSIKQEVNNKRDHFHVLLRTVSYTLHGTIPASTICADRYDREAVVRELSEIAKLKPPLMLAQLPSTPNDLLKLDHIFIKTELKVGVIYIKAGQTDSEEMILANKEESPLFAEFLNLLGDRITLKGFDRYKGGLDTVHDLTGTESVYTMWRNIEIMFHVSTMLPHEENDPQKLQKKRHIGNDIVCVAFIESDDSLFWPGCIKSYFLHTFIIVRTSPKPLKEGEKRKYSVSCVCRNEVQYAFKPYLAERYEFYKCDFFREWLLVKIVNGERASYSAPKFARMQDRTRSQLLEDIVTNLANHLVTGQFPKTYRRGSWRPIGHNRLTSPLEDSMKDYFEDYDQLARDFCQAFCGSSKSVLCDVVFKVKDENGNFQTVHGVRAILAIRSKTFLEMLYGFAPPGTVPSLSQSQTNLQTIELKALSGEPSNSERKSLEPNKYLPPKRSSIGVYSGKKSVRNRRQSMIPNVSISNQTKTNYLTVPDAVGGGGGGGGGLLKNALNRLVTGNWSGWAGNVKSYKNETHIRVEQNRDSVDRSSIAICKEIAKIDSEKLAKREFEIKEFDYETFQQTVEYIHNGQCKLSFETIPGLICAAEHYDLPDLVHACFQHANTHIKLGAIPKMMNALYQNSCFYVTAMQLLESLYEHLDPLAAEFFARSEYVELCESVFTTLLTRKTLQLSEIAKYQAMDGWARFQVKVRSKGGLSRKQHLLECNLDLVEKESATSHDDTEQDYRNLMNRLNNEVNVRLEKISNEDLVKVMLPTKVFSNDKIFNIISDEFRSEC